MRADYEGYHNITPRVLTVRVTIWVLYKGYNQIRLADGS